MKNLREFIYYYLYLFICCTKPPIKAWLEQRVVFITYHERNFGGGLVEAICVLGSEIYLSIYQTAYSDTHFHSNMHDAHQEGVLHYDVYAAAKYDAKTEKYPLPPRNGSIGGVVM